MGMWQQIALAALAVGVIFLFGPGAKRVAENSPSGSREEWLTVVKLLGAVVLFVLLMIVFVRS
jgi:hypothetical protein